MSEAHGPDPESKSKKVKAENVMGGFEALVKALHQSGTLKRYQRHYEVGRRARRTNTLPAMYLRSLWPCQHHAWSRRVGDSDNCENLSTCHQSSPRAPKEADRNKHEAK
jgi:hypothetical protein